MGHTYYAGLDIREMMPFYYIIVEYYILHTTIYYFCYVLGSDE